MASPSDHVVQSEREASPSVVVLKPIGVGLAGFDRAVSRNTVNGFGVTFWDRYGKIVVNIFLPGTSAHVVGVFVLVHQFTPSVLIPTERRRAAAAIPAAGSDGVPAIFG
jgi:hypothetical protein